MFSLTLSSRVTFPHFPFHEDCLCFYFHFSRMWAQAGTQFNQKTLQKSALQKQQDHTKQREGPVLPGLSKEVPQACKPGEKGVFFFLFSNCTDYHQMPHNSVRCLCFPLINCPCGSKGPQRLQPRMNYCIFCKKPYWGFSSAENSNFYYFINIFSF